MKLRSASKVWLRWKKASGFMGGVPVRAGGYRLGTVYEAARRLLKKHDPDNPDQARPTRVSGEAPRILFDPNS